MKKETTKLNRKTIELPPTFQRVRRRLKELGITQVELAEKLDKSQANISKALRGKNEEFLMVIVDFLVQKHGDKKTDYIDTAADRIASQIENLEDMARLVRQINEKVGEISKTLDEVQAQQEKARDEINNIKTTLRDRKMKG